MVLKLKPVQTKKIVAAPSPVTFEPVSKRTSTKYDDNKIAERIPIEEVRPLLHLNAIKNHPSTVWR